MQEIILSDIVLTKENLEKLQCNSWSFTFLYNEETYLFYKEIYVSKKDLEVYENEHNGTDNVIIAFRTNVLLNILEMNFYWQENDIKIEEESELGQLLSAYLLIQFEKIGYLSFKENIKFKNIKDYPNCYKYIKKQCEIYQVEVPEDTIIYLMSLDLWKTLNYGDIQAAFYPSNNIIITLDIEWSSNNWFESLLVHEFIHSVQFKRNWLLSYKEIGLPNDLIENISYLFMLGFELEEIIEQTKIERHILKKLYLLLNQQKKLAEDYISSPVEQLAFIEQFNFLKWLGISEEKIEVSMLNYLESLSGNITSRNKVLLQRMINSNEDKILQLIKENEEFYDNPL